ncbi:energy transducer TonB [Lysobacter sp. A289]
MTCKLTPRKFLGMNPASVKAGALTGSFALLTACAAPTRVSEPLESPDQLRQGEVQARLLDASASERYQRIEGVEYEQPWALPGNQVPAYPASQVANRLPPVKVVVRLIVSAEGRVTEVQPINAAATPEFDAFFPRVRESVQTWKFYPLVKVTLGPVHGTVRVGDISMTYKGEVTPLPFHQDYAFDFTQHNGKPKVTVE